MTRPEVAALAEAIHRTFGHGYHGGGWDNGDGDLAHGVIAALEANGWSLAPAASETGLPPGMRLVPGPVGTCDWGSHHWIKDRWGQTICAACNTKIEPIPAASEPGDAADLWTRLANDIRAVDGNHDLGAGELAHRLVERGWTLAPAASETGLRDAIVAHFNALHTETPGPACADAILRLAALCAEGEK